MGGHFRIEDIVNCNALKSGKNSKTLFNQIYNTESYDVHPVREFEYGYIPYRKVYSQKPTQWHDERNHAYLAAIEYQEKKIIGVLLPTKDISAIRAIAQLASEKCARETTTSQHKASKTVSRIGI